MRNEEYYSQLRRQNKKYRKKLMRLLNKNGYTPQDVIRVVDALSGKTPAGKEKAAQELIQLLAEGADREALLAYLDERSRTPFITL